MKEHDSQQRPVLDRDNVRTKANGFCLGSLFHKKRTVSLLRLHQESTSSYSTCSYDSYRIKTSVYRIFNFFYTLVVSLFFGSFAFRRGEGNLEYSLLYALSSILMNFPMCWLFLDKAYDTMKRLFCNQKEYAFKISGMLSVLFASLTTVAGFRIVSESMEVISQDVSSFTVIGPLTLFSLMNLFTTRFVGSVYLLYSIYQKMFSNLFAPLSYKPYFQLLLDMENFNVPDLLLSDDSSGNRISFSTEEQEAKELSSLESYINDFYQTINKEQLKNKRKYPHCAPDELLIFLAQFFLCLIVVNMMPLWINLTYYGSEKINASDSKAFIFLAALSNEAFYINSVLLLVPTIIKWVKNLKRNSSKEMERLGVSFSLNKYFSYFLTIVSFLILSSLAYFSGAGYAEDGRELTRMGFGPVIQSLWGWAESWTYLFIPIYGVITGFSAGMVNLSAVMSFCLQHIALFKENSFVFGKEKVKNLLQSVRMDKQKLDRFNKKGIGELILMRREKTGIQESLPFFQKLFGCCSVEDDSVQDEKELLSGQSVVV